MGNGVSFMENKAKYHGSVLSESDAAKALEELQLDNPIAEFKQRRTVSLKVEKSFLEAHRLSRSRNRRAQDLRPRHGHRQQVRLRRGPRRPCQA